MLNGSQHLGDNNACHRLGFRSLTGWVFSPSNSTASLFGCARSRTRSGRVHDINVEPSDGVAEPRPAGSAHGPAGPPKVMKTPHLAGESACPTLASKGLRFRGAGAFACQPIFLSHLDRRLQRSAVQVTIPRFVAGAWLPALSTLSDDWRRVPRRRRR